MKERKSQKRKTNKEEKYENDLNKKIEKSKIKI
jgi:hypothetical protein